MSRGRPATPIELEPRVRRTLEEWAIEESTPTELSLRARIVLLSARGDTNVAIARRLKITRETVAKWRARFHRDRIAGLLDEPRPGAPSALKPDEVENVRLSADRPPAQGGFWTTRQLANELGLTQTAVSRILRTFALEPRGAHPRHIQRRGLFPERVRYVAGLHVDPPLRALALCHDGRLPRRDADAARPAAQPRSEAVGRLDEHARKASRHGSGAVRWEPFLEHLERLEELVPPPCTIPLLLAGYTALKTLRISRWLEEHPRFETHAIPTTGTWLSLVERWVGSFESGSEPGRSGASVNGLSEQIVEHLESGSLGRPFAWTHVPAAEPARAVASG